MLIYAYWSIKDSNARIFNFEIPTETINTGKTLQSIGQNLKVIAHKQHDTWSIMPNLETTAYLNDILMLLGTQEELNQYAY